MQECGKGEKTYDADKGQEVAPPARIRREGGESKSDAKDEAGMVS